MTTLTTQQAWLILSGASCWKLQAPPACAYLKALPDCTPSVLIFVFYAASFALNTLVIRVLGLSVVYAVWSGIGTVLTALIGYLYFKEPATALKLVSAGLIVIGRHRPACRIAHHGLIARMNPSGTPIRSSALAPDLHRYAEIRASTLALAEPPVRSGVPSSIHA